MANRKNTEKKPKGYYFYKEEEEAFVRYIKCEDEEERERIFNKNLLPAFTTMVESIMRRYKLLIPDEEFKETFDDTISFMMTKIDNFKLDSGYKAYSYCGTICKNYLIYKINKFAKNQRINQSYDIISNELDDNIKLSYDEHSSNISFLTELLTETSNEINKILNDNNKYKLTKNEVKVGQALLSLLENWDELFIQMGSAKFNKSAILLFLRDSTNLTTTEIRNSMKKYKSAYYAIKTSKID